MDDFFLNKARKYIEDHNAFEDVSGIVKDYSDAGLSAIVTARVKINLPGRFIKAGVTDFGVKDREEVIFIFPEAFPLQAPTIRLRDDFPRNFPHINPSKKYVLPCIYEGKLSELLQQSEWMNGILNQLVDWLEKAASNDLMNYDQGWEPMRNDQYRGFLEYCIDDVLAKFQDGTKGFVGQIDYDDLGGTIVTGFLSPLREPKSAHILYYRNAFAFGHYVPNVIETLSDLYNYAKLIGISDLEELIEKLDLNHTEEDKLFLVLLVRRPVKLIGSELDIEVLNFVIDKEARKKGGKKARKRVLPNCSVGMMNHINKSSPVLLQRLSGTKTKINDPKMITLVGCGSLGSKIGIHLARNGNGPFCCIDNGVFRPHNNARHSLTSAWTDNKSQLLAFAIHCIGNIDVKYMSGDALFADYSNSRLIIDTTSSLYIRNFLMDRRDLPPIISSGLYKSGKSGFVFVENEDKSTRLVHIWAHLYFLSLTDSYINSLLFSKNLENVSIGQSCSSQTMIADDAQISIVAASMSLKIQHLLESGIPQEAEILQFRSDENYSLAASVTNVPKFIPVKYNRDVEWTVFLSEPAFERMKELMHQKTPNETGGGLLGSVFLYSKVVVITDILDAPSDSTETPTLFVLGTEGLEQKIRDAEKKTNGKVTYLGTWHSHPNGGNASSTDEQTLEKLLFVRNYEPTVCLIATEIEPILV